MTPEMAMSDVVDLDVIAAHCAGGDVDCPECTASLETPRVRMTSVMAHALAAFQEQYATEWFHLKDTDRYMPEAERLKHWGFLEEYRDSGYWKVTDAARSWLLGSEDAPEYMLTYRGKAVKPALKRVSAESLLGS